MLILLYVWLDTGAQTIRRPLNAFYLGTCGYSTRQDDGLSFSANQGGLAFAKEAVVGLFGERRFMLAENSWYTAVAALPTRQGNVGVRLSYGGQPAFNEQQASLLYARALGKKLGVGLQFNYYGYRSAGLGSVGTVTAELALMLQLNEQLRWGMQLYNPIGGKLAKTGEQLPAVFTLGLGYDVSADFYAGIEIIKEELRPVNMNAGFQYHFAEQFFIRGGMSSATGTGYAGAGFAWKQFRMDISGTYHPQLGWSPGLMLLIKLNKNKEVNHENEKE